MKTKPRSLFCKLLKFLFFIGLLYSWNVSNLYSQMVKVPLEQVSISSHTIIKGTVLRKWSAFEKDSKNINTFITLKVSKTIKGESKDTIMVVVPGGVVGNVGMGVSHTPKFRIKEDVIVFISDDYKGRSTVNQWQQGKFPIINNIISYESTEVEVGEFVKALKNFVNQKEQGTIKINSKNNSVNSGTGTINSVLSAPYINSISPSNAPALRPYAINPNDPFNPGEKGTIVDIYGSNFGSTQGTNKVEFYGADAAEYPLWTETHIQCKVPGGQWNGDDFPTASSGLIYVITPSGTSNGVQFDVAFSTPNKRYSSSSMTFYVNQNGTPDTDGELTDIQNALQTWSGISNSNHSFVYGGTTTRTPSGNDNNNDIGWIESNWPYFSSSIAVNVWWFNSLSNSNQVYESDIFVNGVNFTWSTTGQSGRMDVQNILTHELGHSLNLSDLYGNNDSEKTMYGYSSSGETKQRTLEAEDLAGVRYLYAQPYNLTFQNSFEFDGENYGQLDIKNITQETNTVSYNSPQTKTALHENEYEITAENGYTINGNNYNFVGWTDDLSATNPRTISPTDNETYIALYKYPYHTNNSNTLDITNQRRFIRAHSDEMYLVYESMDKIWLEWSTDGGSSWNMKNSGKPISEGTAKNPSIAQIGQSEFIITYQERRSDGTYNIMAVLFDGVIRDREILHEQSSKNYTDNATPVIACNRSGIQDFVVLWNEADYGPFSPGGLYYRGGKLVLNGQTGYHEFDFPASANVIANTSENSIEPTTASKLSQSQYPVKFQVAWTHNVSSSSSKINYTIFTVTSSGVTYGSIEEPSSGSGCTKNHSPSMVVMDDNLPRLTWVGERQVEAEEDPSKINGTELSNIEKRVIARGRNSQGTWNPTFFKFGSDVNKVTMNYNESGTIGGYAFAWTENESAPYDYYYVRNTTLYNSPITLYNTSGKYVQLSNGDDLSEMYCMGLGTTSPYAFDLSENLEYTGGQQETKLNSGNFLSIGREGVITNGDNEFYFTIKDVIVEGSEIQFSEVNENTTYADLAEFNSYLTTAPFELNDNSSFYYSVQYGLIEKGSVAATLGENKFINFKVQIVDAQNNNVLGEFDNITYTDENIFQYANIGYEVNTEGIGNKTVKLKLVVDYNIEPIYSLSTLFTEDNLFAKRGIQKVNFEGSLEVREYQLAQNYPNPFNPATTINYQIPQDGAVKLVIYDALGREVRTLVNEFKTKGRYEAVFNANNLASGVYIYHLKVNDFVQTRKMMLLK